MITSMNMLMFTIIRTITRMVTITPTSIITTITVMTHTHSHGPGGHTHMPDEISWSGLVALGASGGLVPCETALVLLLTAIALRRVGLGLLLLVSFSLGLALVLMAIGVLVIYAKNLLPSSSGGNPFFRWMPGGVRRRCDAVRRGDDRRIAWLDSAAMDGGVARAGNKFRPEE